MPIGPYRPFDFVRNPFYTFYLTRDPYVPDPLDPGGFEFENCFLALNPPGYITLGLTF
jgi:hypothetical protein